MFGEELKPIGLMSDYLYGVDKMSFLSVQTSWINAFLSKNNLANAIYGQQSYNQIDWIFKNLITFL